MRGQNSSFTQLRATSTSTPARRRSPFSRSEVVSPRCSERTASRLRLGRSHPCGMRTSACPRGSSGTEQLYNGGGPAVTYAAHVPVLKTLHVLGAIFLLGGVSTHALLRPMAARAADVAQQALYQFAWRVQLALVYTGSALVLITGLLMWVGHFKLFTGWLLLGFLLYVAAAGLDGAFLAPACGVRAVGWGRDRAPSPARR